MQNFASGTQPRGPGWQRYIGQVVHIHCGMQSVFIDIGLERTAFLHVRRYPGSQVRTW